MRVAVIFDNFGPYHVARLKGLAKFSASSIAFEIHGIEAFSTSADYGWNYRDHAFFTRHTLSESKKRKSEDFAVAFDNLNRLLDELKPSVVFVPGWTNRFGLRAMSWCIKNRVRLVMMSESTKEDAVRSFVKEWLKKAIVSCADSFLVGGKPHREYLQCMGVEDSKIFEGYDAVDNNYFDQGSLAARSDSLAAAKKLGLERPFFLASNRFIPKKNLVTLLEAYTKYRVQASDQAWKLVLLGDGQLRSDIEHLINKLNISEHVKLPGFKQYHELPEYYGTASAFIHLSTIEQWGLVVNEAMACHLPVIVSSRCGCAPDLVQNGRNGFAVDPFEIDSVVDAMKKISALDSEQLNKMGEESYRIIEDWNIERFGSGGHQAITVALAEKPRTFLKRLLDQMVLRAVQKSL